MLARLDRIEALERDRALPGVLLGELRALLEEAEAWVRIEHGVPETAADAVERCRQMLQDTSRTLLA